MLTLLDFPLSSGGSCGAPCKNSDAGEKKFGYQIIGLDHNSEVPVISWHCTNEVVVARSGSLSHFSDYFSVYWKLSS